MVNEPFTLIYFFANKKIVLSVDYLPGKVPVSLDSQKDNLTFRTTDCHEKHLGGTVVQLSH